ncbi:MAG: thioredoxin family protein [Actinobacteria bacterium]|nr:thioredoxin family protein [Actinomycetota bacterium]
MAVRLGVAAAVLAIAFLVAWRIRRQRPQATPSPAMTVPRQLHRADFNRADAPWLVAYFSSVVCGACKNLGPKVEVLACAEVATHESSYETDRDTHERYSINALPMVLIADREGVVRRAFVGATTATDLWAAVAEVREPGTSPEPTLGSVDESC